MPVSTPVQGTVPNYSPEEKKNTRPSGPWKRFTAIIEKGGKTASLHLFYAKYPVEREFGFNIQQCRPYFCLIFRNILTRGPTSWEPRALKTCRSTGQTVQLLLWGDLQVVGPEWELQRQRHDDHVSFLFVPQSHVAWLLQSIVGSHSGFSLHIFFQVFCFLIEAY